MRTSATKQHPLSLQQSLPIIRTTRGKVKPTFFRCYTERPMARCPLCRERSAKRFCPAKQTTICAVCCGIKREVEIDCPSSCIHLQSGRSYESERKPLDPQLVARVRSYGENFLNQYGPALDALGSALADERLASPWLVD